MSAPTVADYTGVITSEHAQKPNFIAVLSALVALPLQVQALFQSMIPLFDVDEALGVQLDAVGAWVGISRKVSTPIYNVYFSFDEAATTGWDFGTWQPSNLPVAVTSLPDDAYRLLIKARIAANNWDGTTEGAYTVFNSIFTRFQILIQDNYNMSYNLGVTGGVVDSLTLALLTGNYIPLRPQGIRIAEYFVTVDTNPIFSWDIASTALGGWDAASWVREIVAS